ncbi:hypothetical protein D4L85_31905 [Chryseolinea soli]|uniref:Uncharacterized protein n=1 Tax=Chryseolinea soli TaxID=2321403 RepID=A0A385SXX2_9BACT|nr:hypothetical protein D4L85_31905 [Chryseolinea soli]
MPKIIEMLTVYLWLVTFIVGFIRMNGSILRKFIFGLVCMLTLVGIFSIPIIMLCIFDLAHDQSFSAAMLAFGLTSFITSPTMLFLWNRFEKSIK